jgi:membrane-associated protein
LLSSITDTLTHASGWFAYALVGALVFAEDALFFGFVIPGETAAVVGGVLASTGRVSFPAMLVLVVFAAVVGDSVGYEVGRRYGNRILDTRLLRNHRDRLAGAQDYLRRRGGPAVFLGRFIAFFRAVMPALAGMSRMPYPKFLAYNLAGGVVWGVGFVTLGYVAGHSYAAIQSTVGTVAAIVIGVIVLGVIGYLVARRHSQRRKNGLPQ